MDTDHIRLMLLEDDTAHAEAIRRALESSGTHFKIQVAGSLREYRETVAANPPDIALLDMMLPDGRSLELLTSPSEANAFPMLILTSHGNEQAAVTSMKTGALDYIVKSPAVFADMAGILTRALSQWQLLREHRRTEKAVLNTAEQWRTTFDAMNDAVCLLDNENRIVCCNRSMQKFLEKPFHEIIGHTCCEFVHGTSSPLEGCPIVHIKESRQREMMPLSLGNRHFDVTIDPILDDDGNMVGTVHIMTDITKRKRAEEALKESEGKWRSLVNNAPNIIMVVDSSGVLQFINHIVPGVNPQDVIGKSHYDYIQPEYRDTVKKAIKSALDNGKPTNYVIAGVGPYGRISWYETQVGPIMYEGRSTSAILITTDITERMQLEEERQRTEKLESIGTLAGGIAHDFNNLLTGVMGNISLAKRLLGSDKDAFESLEEAEKASQRAKNLTQQLLTFARGGTPIKKLSSIAELVKESVSFALRGSNVKGEFSLPDDLWSAEVDEGQMNQVFNNIVINAVQAMPEGGTVNIEARNTTIKEASPVPVAPGKYLEITIKDQGVGIPKEHLAKIFDPYFTTKQKGSGLGLATTYSIVKNHSGHIAVESKLGSGTTLYIYLPASKKRVARKKEETVRPALIGQGRILVMDDEEMIREMLSNILRLAGYEVEITEEGTEAIEQCSRAKEAGQPFAAVIMDLTIPGGMGGKEAIKKLLEIDPNVKAIVSSGYATDPIMSEYKKYGFSAAVTKPYSVSQLEKILHGLLGRKK